MMAYKMLICMALFLLQSCVKGTGNCNNAGNTRKSDIKECQVDSINISISEEKDLNHLTLSIHNPTSDTINISPIYRICKQQEVDSCMLIGDIAYMPPVLNPDARMVFRISLGLDSIEYSKKSIYIISIRGQSGEKEFVFYTKCHLGNRYQLHGENILEPDTVILPVSYID